LELGVGDYVDEAAFSAACQLEAIGDALERHRAEAGIRLALGRSLVQPPRIQQAIHRLGRVLLDEEQLPPAGGADRRGER
jgi:hypothetical protein